MWHRARRGLAAADVCGRQRASGHRRWAASFLPHSQLAPIILATPLPSSGDHGEQTWCRSSCCRGRAWSGSAGDARGSAHARWTGSAGGAENGLFRDGGRPAAAAATLPPPLPLCPSTATEHRAFSCVQAGGHAGALEVAQSSSTGQLRRSRCGQRCLQRYAAVHRIIGRHRGFRLPRLPRITHTSASIFRVISGFASRA